MKPHQLGYWDTEERPPHSDGWTLYLDVSGDDGWLRPYGKSEERYVIVGGVALTPEGTDFVSGAIPEVTYSYDVPEIKTHDIYWGKGVFCHLSEGESRRLLDDVVKILIRADPVVFGTIVDKEKMKWYYGDRAFNPLLYGFWATIARYNKFLGRINAPGRVIMDEDERRKEKGLKKTYYRLKIKGTSISENVPNSHLKYIIGDVGFVKSHECYPIQLADFVAYEIRLAEIRKRPSYWEAIKPFCDVHEPSKIPAGLNRTSTVVSYHIPHEVTTGKTRVY